MYSVCIVAGARPNFMKIAPIVRAMKARREVKPVIVHTGQHYDQDMSQVFFDELGLPRPDHFLSAGGGSHGEQTARIMAGFEQTCREARPDHVLVVGDVNSTLACSITAKKMLISVSHVEAGLRSFDRRMPEEINRLATDAVSDIFFCTEEAAVRNLRAEGQPDEKIHFVGNVMVDTLLYQRDRLAEARGLVSDALKPSGKFGVVTLHRPSNVDDEATLRGLVKALSEVSERVPLIFPAHPRTRAKLERFGLRLPEAVRQIGPLGYMDFLNLWRDAAIVLTDSGGLQEETTALGVPCLTLRENTERPITVEQGTNTLVGNDPDTIVKAAFAVLDGRRKSGARQPPLWDGRAAERIVEGLAGYLTSMARA